ncbi:hypothetical protein IQ07DRAFT_401747 [Pyrenochaeta sp. DS3sAY3a]|nr:hypothetical protein IQ07DRAFT_401747 [Pyrenochaeta sp. DS3sAY3a]
MLRSLLAIILLLLPAFPSGPLFTTASPTPSSGTGRLASLNATAPLPIFVYAPVASNIPLPKFTLAEDAALGVGLGVNGTAGAKPTSKEDGEEEWPAWFQPASIMLVAFDVVSAVAFGLCAWYGHLAWLWKGDEKVEANTHTAQRREARKVEQRQQQQGDLWAEMRRMGMI